MITVACVWVKANVPYGVEYVTNLRRMVAKHLPAPHQFVCLTDRPKELPSGIEKFEVSLQPGIPGWWAKPFLFSPELERSLSASRMLYLDLDTLVVDSLSCIVEYPAPFALVPHAGTFNGRNGKAVVKRFNSSVMVWDPGACGSIYENLDSKVVERLWGDQDFIGEQMPYAATMPAEWFPRISELDGDEPDEDAVVVLCKKPKNSVAAALYPWVDMVWRAA